jgi:hypothetical protein
MGRRCGVVTEGGGVCFGHAHAKAARDLCSLLGRSASTLGLIPLFLSQLSCFGSPCLLSRKDWPAKRGPDIVSLTSVQMHSLLECIDLSITG